MIREHIRNALWLEPRSLHERNPSVQERSFEFWIRPDSNVRVEKQATHRQRGEDILDEPLLVLDVVYGEEGNNEVEWSFWQWSVQILAEKLDACAKTG